MVPPSPVKRMIAVTGCCIHVIHAEFKGAVDGATGLIPSTVTRAGDVQSSHAEHTDFKAVRPSVRFSIIVAFLTSDLI